MNDDYKGELVIVDNEIMDYLISGWSKTTIIKNLMSSYGLSYTEAHKKYYEVIKDFKNSIESEKELVFVRNIVRLENLIDKATKDGDSIVVLKAISEENKMMGIGNTTKIDVGDSTKFKFEIG